MAFDIDKAAKKATATKLLDKIQSRTPGKRSRAIGVTSMAITFKRSAVRPDEPDAGPLTREQRRRQKTTSENR